MPKHPIYTELLDKEAQDILGKPHENSRPAMELLESQGFHYTNHIDIFDGGPSIETRISNVEVVKNAVPKKVAIGTMATGGEKALVGAIGLSNFVCVQAEVNLDNEEVSLPAETLQSLGVEAGDTVLVSPLKGKK